jgi:hypothetical protein
VCRRDRGNRRRGRIRGGFHLAGNLFGFEQGDTHWHTAEALSDTRVLIFQRRQIERAATRSAEVACQLWIWRRPSLRILWERTAPSTTR